MALDFNHQETKIIFENPADSGERDERAEPEAEDAEETYRGDYTSDSETEVYLENCQYVEDVQQYMNVIAPIRSMLNQTEEGDNGESSLQNIRQAINAQSEEFETIHDTVDTPYSSMTSFVSHSLFLVDDRLNSEEKIMYCLQLLWEMKEQNPNLTLPASDAIMNFQDRVKNRIPIFKTTEHKVMNKKTGVKNKFYMNPSLEYVKHILADPMKAPEVTALPDETPDELVNMQHATKWKEHILVVAPVLFIPGDNTRHSQLGMHKPTLRFTVVNA